METKTPHHGKKVRRIVRADNLAVTNYQRDQTELEAKFW